MLTQLHRNHKGQMENGKGFHNITSLIFTDQILVTNTLPIELKVRTPIIGRIILVIPTLTTITNNYPIH